MEKRDIIGCHGRPFVVEGCVRIRSLHQVMQALHIGVEFYTGDSLFFGLCSCEANRVPSQGCSLFIGVLLIVGEPFMPSWTLFYPTPCGLSVKVTFFGMICG